jgi:hypothetical protein
MSEPSEEVVTRVGRVRWDDHRFCGYGAHSELLGNETFLGLTFLAATGRRATDEEREVIDALAVSMAAADPRIWPPKITRLVAAFGGTIAGFVAGQLCTECDVIGPWVTGPAAALLVDVQQVVGTDGGDESAFDRAVEPWLATRRRLLGYGVAFRADDERFVALRGYLERRGRTQLPYWRLQERLSALVLRHRALKPNIALGAAALLLDMGLTPSQAQAITNLANVNTFYANAIEGAQQRSATLRSLPESAVRYVGPPPRAVPKAMG